MRQTGHNQKTTYNNWSTPALINSIKIQPLINQRSSFGFMTWYNPYNKTTGKRSLTLFYKCRKLCLAFIKYPRHNVPKLPAFPRPHTFPLTQKKIEHKKQTTLYDIDRVMYEFLWSALFQLLPIASACLFLWQVETTARMYQRNDWMNPLVW